MGRNNGDILLFQVKQNGKGVMGCAGPADVYGSREGHSFPTEWREIEGIDKAYFGSVIVSGAEIRSVV
jgi:hypothetical protein